MSITAADVNKLRQMTGAGMMDCKKALTEANGDFEAAVDILRKAGQKVAAKRADNETNEGVVLIALNVDHSNGKLIALACETEPVSKVDAFNDLAKNILEAAVKSHAPSAHDLLAEPLADGRSIEGHIIDLTGKIGEKIGVSKYEVMTAEKVVAYIHAGNKLGVLVSMNSDAAGKADAAGKDVAMQIAAMNPVAVDKDGVDAATIEREIEIAKEQIRAEGKPEEMVEKIAMGKLNKFYKDATLLNQEFVKDSSKSVAQMLNDIEKGLTVSAFKRVVLGA